MQKDQSAVKDSPTVRRGNSAYAAIAATFTILQLLAVTLAPTGVSLATGSDAWEYQELAAGIRHGCGFARLIDGACAQPEILRTPGYPVFVALFPNWRLALVAQALLCGLVCLLAGIWVGRRWGVRVGVAAQLLIFANIPSFVLSAMLLSETLFQTVLFLAVLMPLMQLSRIRNESSILTCAMVSGVLIGCLKSHSSRGHFRRRAGIHTVSILQSVAGEGKARRDCFVSWNIPRHDSRMVLA